MAQTMRATPFNCWPKPSNIATLPPSLTPGPLSHALDSYVQAVGTPSDRGCAECLHVSRVKFQADPGAKIIAADESLKNLNKDLNDLLRAFHAAENVVTAVESCNGPPKASFREIVRSNSDPEEKEAREAERNDVWRRAVVQRKKLVTLGLVKDIKAKGAFQDVFKKAGRAQEKRVSELGAGPSGSFVANYISHSQGGVCPRFPGADQRGP